MAAHPALSPAEKAVEAYYDGNTRRFLRFGGGQEVDAIHRALWAPGVTSQREAMAHANRLVAKALVPVLEGVDDPHVIDLGCGVGGTAMEVAVALSTRVTGITLSGVQADLARERATQAGLSERCRFVKGSFLDLSEVDRAQGAYAIEAFLHAESAERFFVAAAQRMECGARLVICDDVLAPPPAEETARGRQRRRRTVERFRRGWRVGTLKTVEQMSHAAKAAGFELEADRDLTAFIPLGRPRDKAIALLVKLIGWFRPLERWPAWANFSGGDALQACLRNGWVQYRLTTWRKK